MVTPAWRLPALFESNVKALPMVALARLWGPMAPVPEFMPISLRIGPFTMIMFAIEVVELPKGAMVAMARITGKYSGRAPAMTALTATFSTVRRRPPPGQAIVLTTS